MKRLTMTVAAAALVPAVAFAESHAADPAMEPKPMEQAQPADTVVPMDANPVGSEMAKTDVEGADPTADVLFHGPVKLSAIAGSPIYTISAETGADWDLTVDYTKVADNWERIGSVEDVVLSADGRIEGVLAEVGGFLGIGDKLVLLPVEDMKTVLVDEASYSVVTRYTSEQLTGMDAYEDTAAY
ncbi:PRC-barrel domain-containing protein [Maliponia aquimaris]|uniref:PRC-barrel domain protein n=1 Tax=Maliponia aquimaris TaxID=1673631 RepID=A0A238L061_9RHOB|nr:PRC-barrel domain-containing protein [Maliponia aquimaris]SMX48463.1 PRC-barrel domain protein [Maliponia aquimaris]